MRTHITKAHQQSFESAPKVSPGDRIRIVRHDDKSPGWFFGVTAEGKEGFFPLGWFDLNADESSAIAQRAYDAAELTIEVGVEVECIETESGWHLVRTTDGREGWIPSDCVK